MVDAPVKSAQRVLEVLEYFARHHEVATLTQICDALGYPQSSTSMLVQSLVKLGYLSFDASDRTYRPTVRVMLLGARLHDEFLGESSLLSMMERLRLNMGCSVILGIRQDLHVRYVLSLRGTATANFHNAAGILRPLCRSAIGQILLADLDDEEVERIARSANAVAAEEGDRVDVHALAMEIREVRQRGWAQTRHFPRPGLDGLAVRLPGFVGHPPMGLGVGLNSDRLATHHGRLLHGLQDVCQMLRDLAPRPAASAPLSGASAR